MTRSALLLILLFALGGCANFAERPTVERSGEDRDAPGGAGEVGEATEPTPRSSEDNNGLRTTSYSKPEPEPLTQRHPRDVAEVSGPAVVSLHQQAASESNQGRFDNAVAVLERALRIEPRNAFIWSSLARAHQQAGSPELAMNAASRALSFARGNPFLEETIWQTMAQARAAAGDAASADAARDRAQGARLRQTGG